MDLRLFRYSEEKRVIYDNILNVFKDLEYFSPKVSYDDWLEESKLRLQIEKNGFDTALRIFLKENIIYSPLPRTYERSIF